MRNKKNAFTAIELLVVIAVICILIGLLIPAIQTSRESSRNIACKNNFRQIGIALNSYLENFQYFPGINTPTLPINNNTISSHCTSPFARMLVHLDNTLAYNGSNFSLPAASSNALAANLTIMKLHLSVLVCPSDMDHSPLGYGRVNYRFSLGPSPWKAAGDDIPESWYGPFTSHKFYRPSDFLDGLSNTIGVSERLKGNWIDNVWSKGNYIFTNIGTNSKLTSIGALLECTNAQTLNLGFDSRSGESWFVSGLHFTNYNHTNVPNSSLKDCAFAISSEPFQFQTIIQGVFSASSFHSGGVNTLSMDGSVHYVKNSIDIKVWQAFSTKSAGDISTY